MTADALRDVALLCTVVSSYIPSNSSDIKYSHPSSLLYVHYKESLPTWYIVRQRRTNVKCNKCTVTLSKYYQWNVHWTGTGIRFDAKTMIHRRWHVEIWTLHGTVPFSVADSTDRAFDQVRFAFPKPTDGISSGRPERSGFRRLQTPEIQDFTVAMMSTLICDSQRWFVVR